MKFTLRAWFHRLPLKKPYRLSFATLKYFETIYTALEGEGRIGYGEITPLPGYGGETLEQSGEALKRAAADLSAGKSRDEVITGLTAQYPMTASGLACAFETWDEGAPQAFQAPIPRPVPLAILCPADTPESMSAEAKRLVSTGHTVFKLKAGRAPALEETLVRAAAKELPPAGSMRLDANQAYSFADALELCRRLEDMAECVLLEQPFKREMWEECAKLTASTSLPIMIDESVWTKEDVIKTKECGAKYIKLKLCKHPGIAASLELINEARRLGLTVIYGNGVQTALGNHIESRIHVTSGLKTATEASGFLKVEKHPYEARMSRQDGNIHDKGIEVNLPSLSSGQLVVEEKFTQ